MQNRGLHDKLVGLADGRGDAANGAPRVHDRLATSDRAAGLQGAVLEAPHHLETKLAPIKPKATQYCYFKVHLSMILLQTAK